jgi:hypothetical protein
VVTYIPGNSTARVEKYDEGYWFGFEAPIDRRLSREFSFWTQKPLDGRDSSVSIAWPASDYRVGVEGLSTYPFCGCIEENYPGPWRRIVAGSLSLNPVNEFYNTILDHYFLTAHLNEAINIDAGGSGPGWTRTGHTFKSGGSNAVCRFRGVQAAGGPNGHFYTADPAECERVKRDPGWLFESLDFSITPTFSFPGEFYPGRACPDGLVNVYRAYNNRVAQHDSNHRITADFAAYRAQVLLGWVGEGVVMCAEP